ncbi:MAG: hypothetical protein OHK0046_31000 [Anaerolineae bacterium]
MQWVFLVLGAVSCATLCYYGYKRWGASIRQRAYDQAWEEFSRERLRFLQRLDHELKNPLTAMQIALANLDATPDPEKRREIRAGMRGQILRVSHLISDLRKLATLERGTLERVSVDVGEMLNEVAMGFQDRADDYHFKLEFDAAELPPLTGDRDMLQLAVYNLLDNAIKFTQRGGFITLRAFVEDAHMVIQVEDTGRGIPPEDVPHVWEDLYRSNDVHGIPGSGIGLAMVRGIIERHTGDATITSQRGQGTTVTMRLPLEI